VGLALSAIVQMSPKNQPNYVPQLALPDYASLAQCRGKRLFDKPGFVILSPSLLVILSEAKNLLFTSFLPSGLRTSAQDSVQRPFTLFRVTKESCHSERSEESHVAQDKLREEPHNTQCRIHKEP